MTFTVNHFGPFYLTYLLFGNIKKSAEGRVINVSSIGHYKASGDLFDDLGCQNGYKRLNQYYKSKLFNVLFTVGLNNLLKENNLNHIKTASLHPGHAQTGFGGDNFSKKIYLCLCCCLFVQPDVGARTSLHLSRTPFEEIKSGEYYDEDATHKEMDKRGRDMEIVKKLWEISEGAYKIKFN